MAQLNDLVVTGDVKFLNGIKVGSMQSITLPYTATQGGILTMTMLPSSNAGGYVSVLIEGHSFTISSANGSTNSACFPVATGTIITDNGSSNCTVSYRFSTLG